MSLAIILSDEYVEKIVQLLEFAELQHPSELIERAIDTMYDVIEVECNGEGKIYL